MGCGLGWFVGPRFLLCGGLGWVGLKKSDPRTTLTQMQAQRKKNCTHYRHKQIQLTVYQSTDIWVVCALRHVLSSSKLMPVNTDQRSPQQIYASRSPHLGVLTLTPHVRAFHCYCYCYKYCGRLNCQIILPATDRMLITYRIVVYISQ